MSDNIAIFYGHAICFIDVYRYEVSMCVKRHIW